MKRLLVLLLFAFPLFAQTSGTITANGGIVSVQLPAGTISVTVKISGTFIASLVFEQMTDQNAFTAVGTITSPGSVAYSVEVPQGMPSVTQFRVRATSYLSGIVNVLLTPSTVPATASGATVNITNLPTASFPAVQPVSVVGTVPVSGSVSVSNFPATQPVSIADTVPVSFPGGVSVSNFPATQPVSGTFWQSTQPVSLASVPAHSVSVSNFPATQPVSLASAPVTPVTGTFWQTTQPVSGSVSVGNFPATQAVTGAFYQATQPVSLASLPALAAGSAVIGHVIVDTAPSTPVTGTFWQSTQPVSLSSVPTHAVTQSGGPWSVSGTFWQATQPVSGTFWQSTQPVSIASMPSTPVTGTFWQATQPISGTVTANISGSIGNTSFIATQATGSNLHMVCDSGCSSSAGFSDNSAFSVGSTVINTIGGYYTSGAAPALSSGNAARARIDANSYLLVDVANASIPVTGTFWQATQPVSGTFWQTTQPVSIASMPSTPVTGSFWQATQPVSGTFWQTTQPVSIASMPSTPVTGTFFQATQPVSLASAPTTPVTGTFWQATQPISGTVTDNQGTAAAASGAWPEKITDGTNTSAVKAASTAPAATDPALVVVNSPNGGNPCANPSAVLNAVLASTSGTTAVQIIAASGSTKIYVCSLSVVGVSGTTPTFSLVYGTGTNCATGQTVFLGAWTTAANTVYPFSYIVGITPASQALCYLDTGTTPVQRLTMTYVQQ